MLERLSLVKIINGIHSKKVVTQNFSRSNADFVLMHFVLFLLCFGVDVYMLVAFYVYIIMVHTSWHLRLTSCVGNRNGFNDAELAC
jgi:hypothetical protein